MFETGVWFMVVPFILIAAGLWYLTRRRNASKYDPSDYPTGGTVDTNPRYPRNPGVAGGTLGEFDPDAEPEPEPEPEPDDDYDDDYDEPWVPGKGKGKGKGRR